MDDFFDFGTHPGHLYVVATLLPLLSFVLLLLWNGLRSWLRRQPSYDQESNNFVTHFYNLLGGDRQDRRGAWVATGAIFLSFCLSAVGFGMYLVQSAESHHDAAAEHAAKDDESEKKEDDHGKPDNGHAATVWKGSMVWAALSTNQLIGLPDRDQATTLRLGYYIDSLSALMFVMVTLIASLIHLFSIGYMSDELNDVVEDHEVHGPHGHLQRRGRFTRFFMFMSLFCFSMLNLVLADNLFQIFLSWELVGICSYLLIGFYYERTSAANAANKAFITNRVGDAGFIIGLLILWTYVGTLNFEEINLRIRNPISDPHHGPTLKYAGQIVFGEPISPRDESTGVTRLRIHNPGDKVGLDTQAVLFPRDEHVHGLGPGGSGGRAKGMEVDVYAQPTKKRYGSMPYALLVLAGLGVFLGCVGKSAQFPLHVWLPDAMEGPTPVSALIHAATMVAAGVYLVGRCYFLFTPEVLLVIAYTGAITLFVAATIAVVMTDIKKVLAYSTVSQLGYMMLGLGIGGWAAGLFHLLTHAFFKALLFLGSGSVIFGCHHVQDMNRMGGLFPKMKITAITMLIGVLAISGIPLFSGWYSKDAIIASSFGYSVIDPMHFLLVLLPMLTAGLTAFYMFRMWFMTFTGTPRDEHVHEHAHESPWFMTVPLIVLAFFSIVVAWGFPDFWNPQNSWLEKQLHHSQPTSVIADMGFEEPEIYELNTNAPIGFDSTTSPRWQAHEFHGLAGNLALLAAVVGIAFAAALYWVRVLDPAEASEQVPALHNFLANKWRFDELYSVLLVRPALVISAWCRAFDTYVIDGVLHGAARALVWSSWLSGRADHGIVDGIANWISRVCYRAGLYLRSVQTGYLRNYVLFLVLAAVCIWILLALLSGVSPAAK
jgi:NADH-quinone oxidoreductase subunit L